MKVLIPPTKTKKSAYIQNERYAFQDPNYHMKPHQGLGLRPLKLTEIVVFNVKTTLGWTQSICFLKTPELKVVERTKAHRKRTEADLEQPGHIDWHQVQYNNISCTELLRNYKVAVKGSNYGKSLQKGFTRS